MEGECHSRAMAVDNYGLKLYIWLCGFIDNYANYGYQALVLGSLILKHHCFSLNDLESYGFYHMNCLTKLLNSPRIQSFEKHFMVLTFEDFVGNMCECRIYKPIL